MHNPRGHPNHPQLASHSSSGSPSPPGGAVQPGGATNAALSQPRQVQLPPDLPPYVATEADLSAIKEMFPAFDADLIKSILESNHGSKELTIEALLQLTIDN